MTERAVRIDKNVDGLFRVLYYALGVIGRFIQFLEQRGEVRLGNIFFFVLGRQIFANLAYQSASYQRLFVRCGEDNGILPPLGQHLGGQARGCREHLFHLDTGVNCLLDGLGVVLSRKYPSGFAEQCDDANELDKQDGS